MVAYHQFLSLCQSDDSEARGQAAHLAAMAYLGHTGPLDEQAALYAALISFLDDPSVKVRAALAYGLLHAPEAPRPILHALLQDSEVISKAVAQYSPALIDADLISLSRTAELGLLVALSMRATVSSRLAEALIVRDQKPVTQKLLSRSDVVVPQAVLSRLAETHGDDAQLRGAMLARNDLPAVARLRLVEAVRTALLGARIVKGAIAPARLQRLLRDATDMAVTVIGESEAAQADPSYANQLIESDRVSTRLMLHAIIHGHVLFFADCVAELSNTPRDKVFTLLEIGSRAALNAMLARCGLGEAVRNLIARLVFYARSADLADDVAARHYVVTALTEELIAETAGLIPPELEDAFSYLSEQNVSLARRAARGVMLGFVDGDAEERSLPGLQYQELLALPAA
ncbi:MAG: hypothetical protein JWR75_1209 [Devosia sp.]|nr:hypothetical protein [Devosia sp.]